MRNFNLKKHARKVTLKVCLDSKTFVTNVCLSNLCVYTCIKVWQRLTKFCLQAHDDKHLLHKFDHLNGPLLDPTLTQCCVLTVEPIYLEYLCVCPDDLVSLVILINVIRILVQVSHSPSEDNLPKALHGPPGNTAFKVSRDHSRWNWTCCFHVLGQDVCQRLGGGVGGWQVTLDLENKGGKLLEFGKSQPFLLSVDTFPHAVTTRPKWWGCSKT